MEAVLNCNEADEGAVAHNSHNIDDTKGNPDPHVELLQAGDSNKDKRTRVVTAQVVHGLFSLGPAGFSALRRNQLSEWAMKDNSTLLLHMVEDCSCHIQGSYMRSTSRPLQEMAPIELICYCPLLFTISTSFIDIYFQ